jgi:hypothetical protein
MLTTSRAILRDPRGVLGPVFRSGEDPRRDVATPHKGEIF